MERFRQEQAVEREGREKGGHRLGEEGVREKEKAGETQRRDRAGKWGEAGTERDRQRGWRSWQSSH